MYGCISRSLCISAKALFRSQTCRCNIISNENIFQKRTISYSKLCYLKKELNESENADEKNAPNLPSSFADKYKVFRDEDAPVIFDVNEEKRKIALDELNIQEKEEHDPYEDLNLSHGINGVFEIEDLVEILQREKARQIFVATVPKEYSYVDYIVVATGRSPRQMYGLAAFVRKVYKLKMYKNETIPKIEGENSKDWMALDLGNIALHIFSHEAREKYDLETLWSVGSEYDDLSNEKDIEGDIMNKYKSFLKDLQPAE